MSTKKRYSGRELSRMVYKAERINSVASFIGLCQGGGYICFVKRVANCNSGRLTKGRFYQVGTDCKVLDDYNQPMKPQLDAIMSEKSLYEMYCVVSKQALFSLESTTNNALFEGEDVMSKHDEVVVEEVILIDGRRADEIGIDGLIEEIRRHEAAMAELDSLQTKAKSIKKLQQRHVDAIELLTRALDTLVE